MSRVGSNPTRSLYSHNLQEFSENLLGLRYRIDNVLTVLADLAQLAEHLICNQRVSGSNPLIGIDVVWLRTWLAQVIGMSAVPISYIIFIMVT